jgi:hypothetical protein
MPHSSIVINKKIIPPPPPSLLQTMSLDVSKTLFTPTPKIVGITDTYSFAIWAKLNTDPGVGGFRNLFHLLPASNSLNAVNVQGITANGLSVILNDEVGNRQSKTWDDVTKGNTDTWVHYVVTFGGDTGNGVNGVKLYIDGVDQGAPDSVALDVAGVYTDTPTRRATLSQSSSPWDGLMYSWAIYDSVLTAADVTAMYNGGNARDFDLDNDFGGYASSANLIHYFRLGIGTTHVDFGLDRAAVPSDLSMTRATITSAELSTDIPL